MERPFHIAQAERELVLKVERKIAQRNLATWPELILSFIKNCRERGLAEKTIYNAEKCLQAATLPKWKDRTANEITTQEIRDLIFKEFGDSSTRLCLTNLKIENIA